MNLGIRMSIGSKSIGRKIISIAQSNYIPWKGYFDLIDRVDEFVILDNVQYTKNDWRNRNRIKTSAGSIWLTIPIRYSGKFGCNICDIEVSDSIWRRKHWKTIVQNYRKAPFFEHYGQKFEEIYRELDEKSLSQINYKLILAVADILGIDTKMSWSMDFDVDVADPTERIIRICELAGASTYLSGPAAKNYIKRDLFDRAGIELRYIDYNGYPEYRQLYPPFEHAVSIIDLIFSVGPDSMGYIRRSDSEAALHSAPANS